MAIVASVVAIAADAAAAVFPVSIVHRHRPGEDLEFWVFF